MELYEEKVYFQPGDLVTVNKDLPNKPIMMVERKSSIVMRDGCEKNKILQGIVCRWFTTNGEI